MHCFRQVWPVLVLAATWTASATAQQTTGELELRILDDHGAPVAGARVALRGPDLPAEIMTMTTADGYARISTLRVGTYTLQISKDPYETLTVEEVTIHLGRRQNLGELRLNSTPTETVIVHGKLLIDPVSTEISTNITSEVIELLPTERDYTSVVAYTPQANVSYLGDPVNISGSTGNENAFYIDGINVTDAYSADASTQLPQNFIREIQVKAGGYQAEYGRSTGGIISVITHSGTNRIQGSAFGFYTNNRFAADDRRGFVDLESEGFSRYDVGLSLSGPILLDRMWFFVAYDPNVETEDLQIPGFGVHRDEKIAHQFAGKVTWQPNARTRFDLSTFGDPTTRDLVGSNWFFDPVSLANIDVFLGDVTTGGYVVSLTGSHWVADKLVLDVSASRYDHRSKAVGATERGREEAFFEAYTGEWSGGFPNPYNHHSVRTAAGFSAALYHNEHELKAGLEYETNLLDDEWYWVTPAGGPGYTYSVDDTTFGGSLFTRRGAIRTHIPSVFLQDSWLVNPRLRLNLGVRWDGLYTTDINGKLGQQINDQIQPRLGFIYQLGELGIQKLFGSYGRFYEQVPNLPLAFSHGGAIQYWYDDCASIPTDPSPSDCEETNQSEDGVTRVFDLKGQHFDEFTLGYERVVGAGMKVSAQGVYREIREVIEDYVADTTGVYLTGNPGRGQADFPNFDQLDLMPDPVRRYTALQLLLEKRFEGHSTLNASYALSRNYGNYPGVVNTDVVAVNPNSNPSFDYVEQYIDALGVLPNDRTHVFKAYGAHRMGAFTVGAFFTAQSGTPLSEFAPFATYFNRVFLSPRGSVGRTPWIWDLNFRFAYDVSRLVGARGGFRSRLLLDLFHAFGQREAVAFDQLKFLDSGLTVRNPTFLAPTRHQPPMTIRLGFEMSL